jgi:hypothetical protein
MGQRTVLVAWTEHRGLHLSRYAYWRKCRWFSRIVNDSRTNIDLVWGKVEVLHRSYTRAMTGDEPGTWIYGTCSTLRGLCVYEVQVMMISRQIAPRVD